MHRTDRSQGDTLHGRDWAQHIVTNKWQRSVWVTSASCEENNFHFIDEVQPTVLTVYVHAHVCVSKSASILILATDTIST